MNACGDISIVQSTSNNSRSRSSAHCAITCWRGVRTAVTDTKTWKTCVISLLIEWLAKQNVVLGKPLFVLVVASVGSSWCYFPSPTLIVRLRIQGDCGAYATPSCLGRLYHESASEGTKCISPSSASNRAVFPEPVGPSTKFNDSRLKKTSPLMGSLNLRWDVELVDKEKSLDTSGLSFEVASQTKMALWKPISFMFEEWLRASSDSEEQYRSISSVCPNRTGKLGLWKETQKT